MRSSRGIWKDIPEVCLEEVTPKLTPEGEKERKDLLHLQMELDGLNN